MFLLQATDIKKQYGIRTVLDFESMQVYSGDKIGIVGLNGAGKTTLMQILCGEMQPDSGLVTRHCEVAFIRQLPKQSGTLSGGENAKKHIQREISQNDAIVFADEPTANLDADGVDWVRSKLQAAQTVLLISHDRSLLDAVCTRIVEVKDGKLHFTTGNYSDFEREREKQRDRQEQQYEEYVKKRAQLEAAVDTRDSHVARQRQKKRKEYAKNSSEARLGGYKRAASMQKQQRIAKVIESRIERLEPVEQVRKTAKMALDFSLTSPPGNKIVIRCNNLHFAYGESTILDNVSFDINNGARIAITGKNGSGKSTLLNLIYNGENTAISCAPKLKIGFLHQKFENLDLNSSVLDNVLETSVQSQNVARGVLAGLLFRGDDVYKKAGVLSGGERMRLALAKLITQDNNALMLDEPTNYLDIYSLEAVEQVLQDYPGTLILVSHDSHFRQAVTTQELHIEKGHIINKQNITEKKTTASVDKTLLQLRQIQLVSEISSAPPERKTILEQQYNEITAQLREY